VDPQNIKVLDQNPSDVMKFIISAGVTKIDKVNAIEA
jgi:uncharacterized membrane protein